MKNANMVLIYLFSALAACSRATQRTREMVKRAIARYIDLAAA
jgi:hypothetical protein